MNLRGFGNLYLRSRVGVNRGLNVSPDMVHAASVLALSVFVNVKNIWFFLECHLNR